MHPGMAWRPADDGSRGLSDWEGASGRRGILRIIAGAALLPLLATRAAAAPALASGTVAPIAPPTCDMTFRRTLQRNLPGGAAIVVTRDFCLRFTAGEAGGYVVAGSQVAARVDAPANLATLARIEEQRIETGGFPLVLDAAGLIVDASEAAPNQAFVAALEALREQYGDRPDELATLLDAIRASGAQLISVHPADLFAPQRLEAEERRTIPLPWGDSGEVRVRFTAQRSPDTGLMRTARREVTTSLLGEEEHSAEWWELFPA